MTRARGAQSHLRTDSESTPSSPSIGSVDQAALLQSPVQEKLACLARIVERTRTWQFADDGSDDINLVGAVTAGWAMLEPEVQTEVDPLQPVAAVDERESGGGRAVQRAGLLR